MPLCHKCGVLFPNRVVIDGRVRNVHSRKYCLACSPFKQHNTRKLQHIFDDAKRCTSCNNVLPLSEFYSRGGTRQHETQSHCKICSRKRLRRREAKLKQKCINYKGGQCEVCGYNKCVASLDFHHTDPSQKDFQISGCGKTFENVKSELDKCLLLCSNCHRELHHTPEWALLESNQ